MHLIKIRMSDLVNLGNSFQAERLSCLGGTDVAAILGMHPYKTAFEVWLEKTGQAPPFEGNDATEMGTGLEPYIAAKYERQTKSRLVKGGFVRHSQTPYFGGHLDYINPSLDLGVECKLVGARSCHRWSEPGADQRVPEEYYCQIQWYMMLTGYADWHLVAQREFSKKLSIYCFKYDLDLINRAQDLCDEWWQRYVIGGAQPPLGGSKGAIGYLAKRFPSASGKEIVKAPREADDLMWELQRVEDAKEEMDRKYEALRNEVKSIIGSDLGIKAPGYVATWRDKSKDVTEDIIDWRKFMRDRFAYDPSEEDLKPYRSTVLVRVGSRRLDIKWTK